MPNDERKYIYLEKIMKKVPIRAEAGTYTWRIGDTSNAIPEEVERLMVYALYVGHPDYNFFELARLNLPKKVASITSPELLRSSFHEDHPLADITEYNYGMVKEFADPEKGMLVYGDKKANLWITREDERVLLSRLKDKTPWHNCKSYLRQIPVRYAITLDDEAIEEALANFFMQHGIDPISAYKQEESYQMTILKSGKNTTNSSQMPYRFGNSFALPSVGFARTLAVVFMVSVIGLWIAIFSNISIPFWIIPALSLATGDAALANDPDVKKRQGWFIVYIVFFAVNFLLSVFVFCTNWKWELMDNNLCAFFTLVISGGLFLLSFGITSNGRELMYYDESSGKWYSRKRTQ